VFSYDAAGRVVTRERRLAKDKPVQVHNFVWDQDDRLRQVWSGSTNLFTANYDSNGLRLNTTDASGMRSFQYAGGTLFRETGALGGDITYTPGVGMRSSIADRTFHSDWLGSARYTTDAAAATTGRYAWDAYGQRSWTGAGEYSPGSMQWGAAWGYQTEPATASDAGVGLVLMGQRYYDPEVGRFMSPDPLGLSAGINLYGYTHNDPVGSVDPSGLVRIELRYAKVFPDGPAGGPYHADVIVVDNDGTSWIFGGGPQIPGVSPGRGWGKLMVVARKYCKDNPKGQKYREGSQGGSVLGSG
jgi:RHS repeat-associated protein